MLYLVVFHWIMKLFPFSLFIDLIPYTFPHLFHLPRFSFIVFFRKWTSFAHVPTIIRCCTGNMIELNGNLNERSVQYDFLIKFVVVLSFMVTRSRIIFLHFVSTFMVPWVPSSEDYISLQSSAILCYPSFSPGSILEAALKTRNWSYTNHSLVNVSNSSLRLYFIFSYRQELNIY